MKKLLNIVLVICLIMTYFIPVNYKVEASTTYEVKYQTSDGTVSKGKYTSYSKALEASNKLTAGNAKVPMIYKNGSLVYVKSGTVQLKGSSTLNIYSNANLTTKLTYTHPSYGKDALFIDYNDTYNTIKIKISGVVGYIKASQANIIPSTSSNSRKTYYMVEKSSTYGNQLIHYTNGGSTNLGPAPLYLNVGQKYYSYDGQYFYISIYQHSMADRDNNQSRAVNKYPYFNYYQYLPSRSKTVYTASNINSYIGYDSKIDRSKYYKLVTDDDLDPDKNYIQVTASTSIAVRKGAGTSYDQISNGWVYQGDIYEWLNKGKVTSNNGYNWYKIQYDKKNVGYIASDPDDPWVKSYKPSTTKELVWIGPNTSACDNYSTCFPSNQSMLYNEGKNFISSQTKFGINAAQTLSLSINESGWGRSFIAVKRNNVFGHGAYDSDPDGGAFVYDSVKDSIYYHAYGFMATNYNDPLGDGYYNGTHYGNKLSGNNVAYASDPYWGEKMANYYYNFDRYYGKQDFKNYKIGVKTRSSAVKVYKEPDTSSTVYYNLRKLSNIPVVVLDTVEGTSVDGSTKWYKIQSDVPIDSNRKIITGKSESKYSYDFDTSYAYVPAAYIYLENEKPVITASNKQITKNSSYDPKKDVSAYDAWDGDLTSKISINNPVNPKQVGSYTVTYTVTDSDKNKTTKKVTVQVVASKTNNSPVISGASDIDVMKGDKVNLLDGVKATDFEDGDLTSKISVSPSSVDTSKVGSTKVTYTVSDKDGNKASKTITVTVNDPDKFTYTKKNGSFGFESLTWNSSKNLVNIKGYLTIEGIDNKSNTDIKYDLVLTDQNTKKVYTKSLARWTDSSKWPYKLSSTGKYDYTYSWFNGNVDLADLPSGDYSINVRARSGKYEATAIFRNVFLKDMDRKITDKNKIGYEFKTNYFSNDVPLELFVRKDGLLTTKENPTVDNMLNSVYQINLNNKKLNIFSTSYNVKGNYSKTTSVTRQVVLENISDFKRYTTNVGYTDKGAYTVSMAVSDGLSKQRAWYNASIDISSLPVGTYAIYVRTKSNLDDHGELYDIFNKKIDDSIKIGSKTYTLKRNNSKRYRIELVVK